MLGGWEIVCHYPKKRPQELEDISWEGGVYHLMGYLATPREEGV
jgi:hypothetical protein